MIPGDWGVAAPVRWVCTRLGHPRTGRFRATSTQMAPPYDDQWRCNRCEALLPPPTPAERAQRILDLVDAGVREAHRRPRWLPQHQHRWRLVRREHPIVGPNMIGPGSTTWGAECRCGATPELRPVEKVRVAFDPDAVVPLTIRRLQDGA